MEMVLLWIETSKAGSPYWTPIGVRLCKKVQRIGDFFSLQCVISNVRLSADLVDTAKKPSQELFSSG